MRTGWPIDRLFLARGDVGAAASPRARRAGWFALGLLIGLGLASVVVGARVALAPPSIAQRMFGDVYYSALLTGRDPAAAVAKARFRTALMMHDFGMTHDGAAAFVARVMIEEAGGLCSGI